MTTHRPPSARPPHAVLRPLTFALGVVCAALGLACLPPDAHAQIVAYKAIAATQPQVSAAANGVPLVNIQSPSAAGLSHNRYTQFDVDPRGAILNNARSNALTQLGGWIEGNPNLAAGTARIILNEVLSASPSRLTGYLEVAGSRAQVILANPAGISCAGCGFINASRATLTTGTPIVSGGNLEGYLVERGQVTVQGAGLDASTTDYTELIARAIEVNAGLWAKELKLTAGANRVDAGNTHASPIAPAALPPEAGPAPAFAIDVASLGGMYANKIVLVGTEAGVGVRNAGQIGAGAGDVLVTAEGRLENSGHISAAGPMRLNSVAGIDNAGTLYAQGDLHLATAGGILNRGIVAARGNAQLAASRIDSGAGSVLGAGLHEDGSLAAGGDLGLSATQIATHGQNLAAGSLAMDGASLDLTDSQNSAQHITLAARSGALDARGARLFAQHSLQLSAAGTLTSAYARLGGGSVRIEAAALDNRAGQIVHTGLGPGPGRLTVAGVLDNTGGLIAGNAGALEVTAARLANAGGVLASQGDLGLSVLADTVLEGSLEAGARLELGAAGHLENRATVRAGTTLSLAAARLTNAAGGELSAQDTRLRVTGALENRGLIDGTDTEIDAGSLANLGTGRLYGDTLSIATTTLDNLAEAGPTATSAPVIAARHRLDIGARDITNREQALLFSAGDLRIGGTLDAGRHATGRATILTNASATLEALGNLELAASRIDNSNLHFTTQEANLGDTPHEEFQGQGAATRYTRGDVRFIPHENFTRLLTPDGALYNNWYRYDYTRSTRQTQVATSEPGRILAGGAMTIDATTLTNDKSHILAGGALTLNSVIWYDELGNTKNIDKSLLGTFGDVTNITNVGVATPFALSIFLPPEVWNAITSLFKANQ